MNTTIKFDKVKIAKLITASKGYGTVLDSANAGLASVRKLTAQGEASPEEVVEAFVEQVLPAMEQTKEMVEQIVEAIPADAGEGMDFTSGEGGDDDDDDDDDSVLSGVADDPEKEKRMKDLEEKTASLLKENIQMKKASLAKRHANTYPVNMRKAAEDDFLKENEEEDDLDKLEASITYAEKVVQGYHDANLINKSRVPQSGYSQHTAKKTGKLQTAKNGGQELPWQLRR